MKQIKPLVLFHNLRYEQKQRIVQKLMYLSQKCTYTERDYYHLRNHIQNVKAYICGADMWIRED